MPSIPLIRITIPRYFRPFLIFMNGGFDRLMSKPKRIISFIVSAMPTVVSVFLAVVFVACFFVLFFFNGAVSDFLGVPTWSVTVGSIIIIIAIIYRALRSDTFEGIMMRGDHDGY
jgi:hypothetical protein